MDSLSQLKENKKDCMEWNGADFYLQLGIHSSMSPTVFWDFYLTASIFLVLWLYVTSRHFQVFVTERPVNF